MSTATEKDVATALLGSWPSQVASWGKAGIAAYLSEVAARGVTPAQALVAIRACPADQKFPPSAPELAGLARADPSAPTFDEAYQQLYGAGGVFGFRRSGVTISRYVMAFVADYGRERLRLLEVDHPEFGGIKRRELLESWERFLGAVERRGLAAIAEGRGGGGLSRVDPLAALSGVVPGESVAEIEAGR